MIVCVCNNITEKDLKKNPELMNVVGSKCGKCKEYVEADNGTTGMSSNIFSNQSKLGECVCKSGSSSI